MDEKEIGLKELNEIHREEKKKPLPSPLDADFYPRCHDYLSSLSSEIEKETGDGSMSPRAAMMKEEMSKARKTLESIYSIRQRKILLMAYGINTGEDGDLSILTPDEKHVLEEVVGLLKDSREKTLGNRADGKKRMRKLFMKRQRREESQSREAKRTALPVEEDRPLERKNGLPDAYGKEQFRAVVVLEDIPPFMGYDMDYDLHPQDVAMLPANMAAILEKKGKIRFV